jgi:hypothetical protein
MPNGGIDNCMNCDYFGPEGATKEERLSMRKKVSQMECRIRLTVIPDPSYTYCLNFTSKERNHICSSTPEGFIWIDVSHNDLPSMPYPEGQGWGAGERCPVPDWPAYLEIRKLKREDVMHAFLLAQIDKYRFEITYGKMGAIKWSPITFEDLDQLIKDSEAQLSDAGEKFWNIIKVEPHKWQEHSWGWPGGGFWVVGVFGDNVIYYNDIEEGFNVSKFREYGTIDEYFCNQSELHEVIHALIEAEAQNELWLDKTTAQDQQRSGSSEVQANCSGCYRTFPESIIHVIPVYRGETYGYITAYLCDECWIPELEATRERIQSTESPKEIASAAEFFQSYGHFIHEFKRGDSPEVVKQALSYLINELQSGRLKLRIRKE